MLIKSSYIRVKTQNKYYKYKNEAEDLLFLILEDFQNLKIDGCDTGYGENYKNIIEKYSEFNLSLTDCSTGINKLFIKKEYLQSDLMARFIENNPCYEVEYGWINEKICDSNVVNEILSDFDVNDKTELFPLFSKIAPLNIYSMNLEFMETILSINKIPKDKANKLISIMNERNLSQDEISKILEVPASHQIMNWLGVKTLFWSVTYNTSKIQVSAIIAGVADKNDVYKIGRYILIENEYKNRSMI